MIQITIDQLLGRFDKRMHPEILKVLRRVDVDGALVIRDGDDVAVRVFGPGSQFHSLAVAEIGPGVAEACYTKGDAPTRTAQALDWLQLNPDQSIRAAAARYQLQPSAVSRALKKDRCPHCGQTIKSPRAVSA